MKEWPDWVKLSQVEALDVPTLLRLLEAFGGVSEVLQATYAALTKVAGDRVARAIRAADGEAEVKAVKAWLARCPDARVVVLTDADYPSALLRAGTAPFCLYVRGNPTLLTQAPIGIFGSRTCDEEALYNAKSFAYTLLNKGASVAVWLRPGVALAAVEGARGAVTALLDGPVDKVPEGVERQCLSHILQAGGLIVSTRPPQGRAEEPERFTSVVAAWSRAVLVVGAKRRSRALQVAERAVEAGRDVFAVPGSIHSPYNKGAHELLRRGAKLTECVEDVFNELETNS